MLTALPLSNNNRWTRLLATLVVMTRVSSWGLCTQLALAYVRTMSSGCGAWHIRGLESMVYATVWDSVFAFCKYLFHARRPFSTSRGPLNIISTSLLSGVWLAFLLNLGVFYLYGRALLVIGLVFPCGLATTLSIIVYCNIAIRPEFFRCTLIACGIKYVHLLMQLLALPFVATQPSYQSLSMTH